MTATLTPTYPSFIKKLKQTNTLIRRNTLTTLQVNIGKKCNQACHHCHVDAGPKRTEMMKKETIDRLLTLLAKAPAIKTVDITGGAPELHEHFRYFVSKLQNLGKTVIDRCNLTILLEPNQSDTAQFLAANKVQVVASLPCYTKENVEQQRGIGVFAKSIEGLKILNQLGYGKAGSELILNLVYNPIGAHLPPSQDELEKTYKARLQEDFSIQFNQLFTLTNLPIARFKHQLEREKKLDDYMQLLSNNFNPQAANGVMCTNLISVSWQGYIFDCDFNQMLELPYNGHPTSLWDIEQFSDIQTNIVFRDHCYGCTAGKGSSCQGALA